MPAAAMNLHLPHPMPPMVLKFHLQVMMAVIAIAMVMIEEQVAVVVTATIVQRDAAMAAVVFNLELAVVPRAVPAMVVPSAPARMAPAVAGPAALGQGYRDQAKNQNQQNNQDFFDARHGNSPQSIGCVPDAGIDICLKYEPLRNIFNRPPIWVASGCNPCPLGH
ncbi:hypothetical protein DESUT3_17720 [Desulfuromonas versatilis]|uniref:Uncharacterized protein n=1 Tax=Desulfuromonas versatilis TaxID=2802975 RepID=A0ABM8HW03_9BACT|nr:hypothetical protein DESUT3_17720 [Desulfuromonas versatilis]